MKKIFESEYHSLPNEYESTQQIVVYEVDDEEEYWELSDADYEEWEARTGYSSVTCVAPGAMYHDVSFNLEGNFAIVNITSGLNV